MPEEKPKNPLEELDLGEGLVCDPETGICEIPGTSGPTKPGLQPLPVDTTKKETTDGH